jgi:CPA2 family monovalent cation:H+ antiporter-2
MIQGFYGRSEKMERRFIANFNNPEMLEESAFDEDSKQMLTNHNIHIEEIVVSPNSPIAGKTLEEFVLTFRTRLNIVSIERGSDRINIPGKDTLIFPHDRLIVAATDTEISELMSAISEINSGQTDVQKSQINISLYEIATGSASDGKSIKELDVRTLTQCVIIGIDRNGSSLSGLSSDTILCVGDILWLAGEEDKLKRFKL